MQSLRNTLSNVTTSVSDWFTSEAGSVKQPIVPSVIPDASSIPSPLPKGSFLSPQELLQRRREERDKSVAEGSKELDEGVALVKGVSPESGEPVGAKERVVGAAHVVKGLAAVAMNRSVNTVNDSLRSRSEGRDNKLFLNEFGDFARTGSTTLLSSHEGYVLHEGEPAQVYIFVTTTHLCVSGSFLKDTIPLMSIASVQPSVELPTTTQTPYFILLPHERVKPTAVSVYTNDLKCYRFFRVVYSARQMVADSTIAGISALEFFLAAVHRAWEDAENHISQANEEAPAAETAATTTSPTKKTETKKESIVKEETAAEVPPAKTVE